MMQPEFLTFPDPDAVAAEAATRFLNLAEAAIAARGQFVVALAGGSTPERLYKLLATRELDWEKIVVFFSDDRFLSPASRFSNAGLALRLLPLNPKITYPVPAETSLDAAECAVQYERELVAALGPEPRFDLILLGMGDDGHTASLFPGKEALTARKLVTHSTPGVLPPPVDRITFTFLLINAARNVLFLVTGANKKEKVVRWRAGEGSVSTLPVLGVAPTEGTLTVLLDEAAGS
ncbi:6-phosphogluconolactonase [Armatimonas sp.]|uniref:6-phosphogluconolactonase n=1 Tax=Armatimonas sp. TaxID=1872638 RepID=UPI00286B01E3|nr:6-phosphogluconolactonase [Armatimonas sp.]